MSDLEQAIDRLSSAVAYEETRRVVFLTGSAMSSPEVPGTQEMISIFLDALSPGVAKDLRTTFRGLSNAEQYLKSAYEVQRRRGDYGLAAAIGKGVRRALKTSYTPTGDDTNTVPDSAWNLPEAQRLLGELFSKIPPQQAGAVITTNFDSLTEVAFRRYNVPSTPLAVPGSRAFPIDAICGPLPIVHLHGVWEKTATLSTALQLDKERPQIERMITHLLDNAILVVVGYGGWNDSFTRALSQMVREGHTTSLQTEIMWLHHGKKEAIETHALLREIEGQGGVGIYNEVSASDFLEGVIAALGPLCRPPKPAPLGWTPPISSPKLPTTAELFKYVEGAQPTWNTAEQMPLLRNTHHIYEAVRTACADNTSQMIVVAAPAGEGKSTALLQVASRLAENLADAIVLFRNPGAPRVTAEWVDHLVLENALTILFVDDADLTVDEIYQANLNRDSTAEGKIIWVLAMHTSYLRSSRIAGKLAATDTRIMEFVPFSSDDSKDLAFTWKKHNLLPKVYKNYDTQKIADMIWQAGDSPSLERSLFGSVLHLWGGEDLEDRIAEMLIKVSRLSIAGVSFTRLLSAVAVTQVAWDIGGDQGYGLSLAALGFLANTTNLDIIRLVVEPLGREVGISQIGDRVYMRHPAIAQAIFDIIQDSGELDDIVSDLSHQGCLMRYAKEYYRGDYISLYMLCRHLDGPTAHAASLGAVSAAPHKLEPRVTAIATLRETKELIRAQKYAVMLFQKLENYDDRLQTQRGFFVEWSVVESRLGNNQRAVEIAIGAISDQIPGFLSVDKLEYGLVNISNELETMTSDQIPGASELREAVGKVLDRLPIGKTKFRHLAIRSDHYSLFEIEAEFRMAAIAFGRTGLTFNKMQLVLRGNQH